MTFEREGDGRMKRLPALGAAAIGHPEALNNSYERKGE